MILDMKGNTFGGFTPVKLKLGEWISKSHDSLKIFLFTPKNPHNLPARRFELKAKEKRCAIICDSRYGPWFNGAILVKDNCDSHSDNVGHIGAYYTNDAGLEENTIFTGSRKVQVQEIKVFEITNQTTHFQADQSLLRLEITKVRRSEKNQESKRASQ
jgi:hypothetical protein